MTWAEFSATRTPANPEIPDPKYAQRKLYADDRMPHFMARVGFESSGSDGEATFVQTPLEAEYLMALGFAGYALL